MCWYTVILYIMPVCVICNYWDKPLLTCGRMGPNYKADISSCWWMVQQVTQLWSGLMNISYHYGGKPHKPFWDRRTQCYSTMVWVNLCVYTQTKQYTLLYITSAIPQKGLWFLDENKKVPSFQFSIDSRLVFLYQAYFYCCRNSIFRGRKMFFFLDPNVFQIDIFLWRMGPRYFFYYRVLKLKWIFLEIL